MVEGPGQRYDPPRAHASVGGLESNDTTVSCGHAYGASGIRTDSPITEMRRDSSRRPARRTAWAVISIPWIMNRTEITDHGTATVGELVQVEGAQEHSSGSLESAHNLCVLGGNPILK